MKPQPLSSLLKIGRLTALWLVTFAALWSIVLTLWLSTAINYHHFVTTLFLTFADAAVVALPLIFLRGRSMGIVALIFVWLLAIFAEVNILYCRFFHDLTPFSSFFLVKNFGGLLFKSTFALVKPSDIVLLIIPVAFTVFLALDRSKSVKGKCLSARFRMIVTLFTIILFAGQQVKFYKIKKSVFFNCIFNPMQWLSESKSGLFLYSYNGFTVYSIGSFLDLFNSRGIETLTPEQQAVIDEVLNNRAKATADFGCNLRKNLFLIIVESFNSWPVGMKVDGVSVTPVIDSLRTLDNALWSADMISQIRDGGSSDGQMLYNTGMMPIVRNATVQFFADNRFFSLAEILRGAGYSTAVEVTHDPPGLWNHSVTSKSWGYDILYDIDSLKRSPRNNGRVGRDELLLQFAVDVAEKLPQPFMVEVTTISMHTPCSEEGIDFEKLSVDSLSTIKNDFLNVTRYFDQSLGKFLNRLKANGLLDKSIIVIAADHAAPKAGERMPIFFMILGEGIKGGEIAGTMGQVDVFPTILDVMGRLETSPWQGLGRSVANGLGRGALSPDGTLSGNPTPADALQMKKAAEASNLIIRNNYFNRQ